MCGISAMQTEATEVFSWNNLHWPGPQGRGIKMRVSIRNVWDCLLLLDYVCTYVYIEIHAFFYKSWGLNPGPVHAQQVLHHWTPAFVIVLTFSQMCFPLFSVISSWLSNLCWVWFILTHLEFFPGFYSCTTFLMLN